MSMDNTYIGVAPNGLEITGTLERLQGRAIINFRKPGEQGQEQEGKLSFDWGGDTEVFWDEQRTVQDANGKRIFLDEDGNEWTEDQITIQEVTDEI